MKSRPDIQPFRYAHKNATSVELATPFLEKRMSLGQSYELVGRILAGLVLSGLRAQTIKPEDFGVGENREGLLHFIDVVNWLRNEGLLTTGKPLLNGWYPNVQLTARGIAAVESGSFDRTTGKSVRETVEAKPEV